MELGVQQLQQIADKYRLGKIRSFRKATYGIVNHNWMIKTQKGKYVLRGLPSYRKRSHIYFEQELISQLQHRTQYLLPVPITASHRKTLVYAFGKRFWAYRYIPGRILLSLNDARLREVAKMMSRVHKAAQNIKLHYHKRPLSKSRALRTFKAYYSEARRKQDSASIFFTQYAPILMSILQRITIPRFKRIAVHRDITTENILFRRNNLVGILDFEQAAIDTRMNDIAIFLARECANKNQLDFKKARTFLTEYAQTTPLSIRELLSIPDYAILQFADDFCYFYWVIQHDPTRDVRIKHLQNLVKNIKWYNLHRKRITNELKTVIS